MGLDHEALLYLVPQAPDAYCEIDLVGTFRMAGLFGEHAARGPEFYPILLSRAPGNPGAFSFKFKNMHFTSELLAF